MPYIAPAQKYSSTRPASPCNHGANGNFEKIGRNEPYTDRVTQTAFGQHALETLLHNIPTATTTYGYDGSPRDGAFGQATGGSRSGYGGYGGYGGYEEAGYRDSFYGRSYAARPYGEAVYQGGYYGQQYHPPQPYAGGYGSSAYSRVLPDWQHPASYHHALHPTASARQIYAQPNYGQPDYSQGLQQYAPSHFQSQAYHQYAQSYSQPLLTQQWQAVNDVLPPPPPSETSYTSGFNANAPAFQPQHALKSVTAADLNKRYIVEKNSRYDQTQLNTNFYGTAALDPRVPPSPTHDPVRKLVAKQRKNQQKACKPAKKRQAPPLAQPVAPLLSPGSYDTALRTTPPSPKEPHKHLLKRPNPSWSYLKLANQDPKTTDAPRPLLVVLDLNGTLLYRTRRGGSDFLARPRVYEFLHYMLSNHHVMIWSSARPHNVSSMVDKLFTKEQSKELVGVWGRDTLRLTAKAYEQKAQVYKQLSWIWKDETILAANPDPVDYWNQENTVLIDDSVEKAASEPHSIIKIDEFEGEKEQLEADVLGQVVKYLEVLRSERDVSAYMRSKPFVYDWEGSFDWMPIINDMH